MPHRTGLGFVCMSTLLLLASSGCDKETPPSAQPQPGAPSAAQPAAEEPTPAADAPGGEAAAADQDEPAATARLQSAEGQSVEGTVRLRETEQGVQLQATITGLSPGKHGFHIHEKGDCSAPDFSSAGGHFNPTGEKHGAPTDQPHHYGDFGNIEANEDGVATVTVTDPEITLREGEEGSIVGKAVVVHDKPDDLKSQPSGAAGDRVACGVIEASEPTQTAQAQGG